MSWQEGKTMFHIFILKNFLFISKKSYKASKENLSPFGVICQKPWGRGIHPTLVLIGLTLVRPQNTHWNGSCFPQSHTSWDLFFFHIHWLQVVLVLGKLPMFSIFKKRIFMSLSVFICLCQERIKPGEWISNTTPYTDDV